MSHCPLYSCPAVAQARSHGVLPPTAGKASVFPGLGAERPVEQPLCTSVEPTRNHPRMGHTPVPPVQPQKKPPRKPTAWTAEEHTKPPNLHHKQNSPTCVMFHLTKKKNMTFSMSTFQTLNVPPPPRGKLFFSSSERLQTFQPAFSHTFPLPGSKAGGFSCLHSEVCRAGLHGRRRIIFTLGLWPTCLT